MLRNLSAESHLAKAPANTSANGPSPPVAFPPLISRPISQLRLAPLPSSRMHFQNAADKIHIPRPSSSSLLPCQLHRPRMLTPHRHALSRLIDSLLQLPRDNFGIFPPKIVKIRHTLLPLFPA